MSRRIAVLVVALAAVAVLALAGSAAAQTPSGAPLRGAHLRVARLERLRLARGVFTPSLALATYPISGSALNFDGSALSGAEVDWGWFDPEGQSWWAPATLYHQGGKATTAGDGSFSFAAVDAHQGADGLSVTPSQKPAPSDGLLWLDRWGLDFSSTSSYKLQPAHVEVDVTNGPTAGRAEVFVGDVNGADAAADVSMTGGTGTADAAPPDYTGADISFDNAVGNVTTQGDWVSPGHAPVAVSAGAQAGAPITFDWSKAVHAHLLGSLCTHSGSPGSTVRLAVSNLPAGEQLGFFGFSWSPRSWGPQSYAHTVTSLDPATTYVTTLRVPERATAGQPYEIDSYRTDDQVSPLDLYDYYLVCDIAASPQAVRSGGSVRLAGHVAGAKATLLYRHDAADQPTSAGASGWTKAMSLSPAGANGQFRTRALHPTRTTWYVVRYSGEEFTAFTAVVKVTVK